MQRICSERSREIEHLWKLMGVVAGDGGVDLHGHAQILQIAEASNGGIECAGNAAESVVGQGVGAIQADGHAPHAAIDDHAGNLLGHQRAVCGQRDAQTLVRAIACQLENV